MLVCPLCRIALAANESVCPRDGQAGRESQFEAVAPALAKRFQVVEPFAQGRAGSLYLADEPETGRRGLLKLFGPASSKQPTERQRLRRELIKLATLESRSVVAPYASGETDGQLWLFRPWLEGVSLAVRLAREGALPQPEALAIAAQLALSLDELHRAGMLHRDLKPGHVLLEPKSDGLTRVRILDSGICSVLEQTGEALAMGTPGYVAPEQLSGKLVSFRSDLYALGCVLFEMVAGRPAFPGAEAATILAAQRAGELPEPPTGLPEGVGPLLKSLLAKDPQERPFSAQKLRRTLDPYLPDGAPVTRQPTQTYASVPEPKKPAPAQPGGTLRPPPPPAGASPSRVPPAPPRSGVASGAPAPKGEESTQMLEIAQIIDAAPARPRPSAPPPPPKSSMPPRPSAAPPPRAGGSLPPAKAAGSLPPPPRPSVRPKPLEPTEAIDLADVLEETDPDADVAPGHPARPNADHTQPIRLEQVLAVAEARKRVSAPPVEPPRPAKPVATEPAPISAAPQAPVPVAAAPTAEPSDEATLVDLPEQAARALPAAGSDLSMAQTIELPAPLATEQAPTAPYAAVPADAQPAVTEAVAPSDHEDQEGDPDEEERTSVAFRPAAASMATSQKRTLLGTGMPAPAALATAAIPSSSPAELRPPAGSPPLEQTAREARGSASAPSDSIAETGEFPAPSDPSFKRYLPYAAAALVALGLGGALVRALSGDEPESAVAALESSTAPAAAAPAVPSKSAPAVAPLAEAPKAPAPTVVPIVPAPTAAAAPSVTAPSEASEEKTEVEPAPVEREARREREPRAERERASRSSRSRESARSSKSSDKDAANKKERWAEARQEARAHYSAGRYKQAAQAYEVATRNDPTHAGSFAGLGAARLASNDAKGAVQAYKKAVDLSPTTAGFHAALGKAYLAAGDKSRAKAAYKRALALDPKNQPAKDALAKL